MAILALIEKEEVIWRMGKPRPAIPHVMFETRGHLPPPAWPELKFLCVHLRVLSRSLLLALGLERQLTRTHLLNQSVEGYESRFVFSRLGCTDD